MPPEPHESPEGSPASGQSRPGLPSSSTDKSELDLWDMDDAAPAASAPPVNEGAPEPESPKPAIPAKSPKSPKPAKSVKPVAEAVETKPRAPKRKENDGEPETPAPVRQPIQKAPAAPRAPRRDDLGELEPDEWDESPSPAPKKPEQREKPEAPADPAPPASAPESEAKNEVPADEASEEPEIADEAPAEDTPEAVPVPSAPAFHFSKAEKLGMASLGALLLCVIAAFGVLVFTRLPTSNSSTRQLSFPIKGSHLTVKHAATYWRPPVREGPNADAARLEAKLLPAIALEFENGPGAVRVFFRNDAGEIVGDVITRPVQGGKIEIAATNGFDDSGLLVSYQADQTRPWTLEVFEAPSVDSPKDDFKKLFDTPVSTERR